MATENRVSGSLLTIDCANVCECVRMRANVCECVRMSANEYDLDYETL